MSACRRRAVNCTCYEMRAVGISECRTRSCAKCDLCVIFSDNVHTARVRCRTLTDTLTSLYSSSSSSYTRNVANSTKCNCILPYVLRVRYSGREHTVKPWSRAKMSLAYLPVLVVINRHYPILTYDKFQMIRDVLFATADELNYCVLFIHC